VVSSYVLEMAQLLDLARTLVPLGPCSTPASGSARDQSRLSRSFSSTASVSSCAPWSQ
jgi:hypothetical protein